MDAFELQDELNALAQNSQSIEIPNERDFSSEDPTRLLEGLSQVRLRTITENQSTAAVEAVANQSSAIEDPEVFDIFRSVLKHSISVTGPIMNKVLDSIASGLQGEVDSVMRDLDSGDHEACFTHKIPLEKFAFLLYWFVTVADNVKRNEDNGPLVITQKTRRSRGGKSGGGRIVKAAATARVHEMFSWEKQIPSTFKVITKAITMVSTYWQRIWAAMTEKDTFIRWDLFKYNPYFYLRVLLQLLGEASLPRTRERAVHERNGN